MKKLNLFVEINWSKSKRMFADELEIKSSKMFSDVLLPEFDGVNDGWANFFHDFAELIQDSNPNLPQHDYGVQSANNHGDWMMIFDVFENKKMNDAMVQEFFETIERVLKLKAFQ